MNIEKEFKNLIQSQVQTLDEDSFINKLHLERKKRYAKNIGFMNVVSAAAFLAIFGFALVKDESKLDFPALGKPIIPISAIVFN